MNKKDYKGYELIKAIHDGEIKDCTIIEVHDLSTVDHIKARITYSNKRLNWIAGDFDTTCLFDDNIYFRVLEDNTEKIEEIGEYCDLICMTENEEVLFNMIKVTTRKVNELVRKINYIERKINGN